MSVATPEDPLKFDFGIGFESSADRIKGEQSDRRELVKRELPFHVPYLDDCLGSILPHDLVLIGASTGAGKTEIARIISAMNARDGRRVYYFALEAEPREIERRTKFAVLCELLADKGGRVWEMNYADWYRGKCDKLIENIDAEADQILTDRYRTLHTYYRGSKFDLHDIKRLFLAIQSSADLIVVDHLHFVDIDDDNENRGFKSLIKVIRDVALGIGKPVILIAHLRKTDRRIKSIVPHIEDFHGSSEIIKAITKAVMLAPAHCLPSSDFSIANTFMYAPKDRMTGANGMVALCGFDRRLKSYGKKYTLGRANGDQFEPLGSKQVPRWASERHEPLTVPMLPAQGVTP